VNYASYPCQRVSRLLIFLFLFGLSPALLGAGYHIPVSPTRIIFLHHSCGENLINQGNVREGLTALGYEFFDHGYNGDGLRLADGSYTGTNFDVPGDNTDPDGLAAIFDQPLHDPPDNTFSYLVQYDVVAFKSCYPASNIVSDEHLAEVQSYYLSIRDRMDGYPNMVFVIVTQPPQVPGGSDPEEARRAWALTDWLQSDEYLDGHPNVFTFDFFGLLADDSNFLRAEYRFDDYDGHPNEQANRAIGPRFVEFLDQAIQSYMGETPRPTLAVPTPLPAETAQPEITQAPQLPPPSDLPPAAVIDDFESSTGFWDGTAETGSTIECGHDGSTFHNGQASLYIDYNITLHGWGDCGRYFEPLQDWSTGSGLSLWLRSEEPEEPITLMLFSGEPDGPTPFEVALETTLENTEEWVQVTFLWADFAPAAWADADGLSQVDPGRVTGYGFSITAAEGNNAGHIWIDDVSLATGEEQSTRPADVPTATPVAAPLETESGEEVVQVATEEHAEEPSEIPIQEPEPRGGICPAAMVAVPMAVLGFLLVDHRQR
jgi:hypothetical protein